MALRGNLKDFSLPDVFQLVQLSGKTGVLRIVGQEAEGSIWFRNGDVFFAQSNWRRERLGERLVGAQRITPAALARAIELRSAEGENGRRLGEILVNEGYITQQVLETFVQEQIQDTIFDLMRWDDGEFDFEVLPDIVHEDIGLSVSVENIVMEGARRLEEWQRIKKKVPSTDMVFKMATAPGEGTFEISLKPIEWALLLLIDGTRSVRDLAVETHSTDFEVARVVYGLFSAGLLEVPSDDEVERLRADRSRRDDRRASLEAEHVAADSGQAAPAPDPKIPAMPPAEVDRVAVVVEDQDERERFVLEPPVPETEVGEFAPVEERRAPEEPEFLALGAEEPSPDDMAVFEQLMASVLAPQVGGEERVAEPAPGPRAFEAEEDTPYVSYAPSLDVEPTEEPTGEPTEEPTEDATAPIELLAEDEFAFGALSTADLKEIPAPPVMEAEALPEGFLPSGDFETDLRSLGLGEYPEELLRPESSEQTPEPTAEPDPGTADEADTAMLSEDVGFRALAEETETETETGRRTEPEPEADVDDGDLSRLLASLGADTPETEIVSSDTDHLPETGASAGVISTDVFLAEFDDAGGFSGGLGDELTALTGGATGRGRPATTVTRLPEAGEAPMLHRDQLVDRELLEKIIKGVEDL